MADDDIKFRLDLDADEFKQVLKDATSEIKSFGDPSTLSGLIITLGNLPNALGVVKEAILALKAPLDLVFEGERLRAINAQFELLTRNAGISSEALKAGLEKAAGGLIDTSDLLQMANKSIVAMGVSADKLPQILELARKASVVTGKSVADTFEELSQAISTGQTRALKHMGIVVDLDKAYEKYADSIGVAAAALSDAEKRQALANEALERGNKALAGVDVNASQATNAWQELKVALQDLKETFVLVFEKTIGPSVKTAISNWKWFVGYVKETAQNYFGVEEGAKRATDAIQKQNDALKATGAGGGPEGTGQVEADFTKRRELEAKFQKDIAALRLQAASDKQKIAITELEFDQNFAAQRIQLEEQYQAKIQAIQESKELTRQQRRQMIVALQQEEATRLFAMEVEAIDKRSALEKADFDTRMQLQTTELGVQQLFFEQQFQLYAAYQEKIRLTQESQVLNEQQKNARILLLEQQLIASEIALQAQSEEAVLRSYENQVRAATTAYQKITAGAALASAKARKEFMDFSSIGASAVNRLGNSSAQAFEQMGEGAIDLGTALRRAILGALADEAMARGALLIASSIFPPNPLGLAAGIGLSTLAGLLRSLAGGGASSASLPTGGAGGGNLGQAGNSGLYTPDTPLAQAPTPNEHTSPRKMVTIQVMGSYFETEQTRTRLVELVREASDATDFKILSVGGGV